MDMKEHGITTEQHVRIYQPLPYRDTHRAGFRAIPYDLPRGDAGSYLRSNTLVPLCQRPATLQHALLCVSLYPQPVRRQPTVEYLPEPRHAEGFRSNRD